MIHYNETVFKDMHNYVEKFLNEEGGLTIERCQKEGLKEYDHNQYIELDTLGRGAYGMVKKCKFIPIHEFHAVKTVRIQGIPHEKMKKNVVGFLVETNICKKLKDINHPNLASFKNSCYLLDSSGNIQSLILITEAGDFSLKDLVECRKNQKNSPPYKAEEALMVIKSLAKAFTALQENRIYHSDIKLANIIYSGSAKKFIIIDFGLSCIIPSSQNDYSESSLDEIEINKVIRGGTERYYSNEKALYMKDEISGEELFNPFKCDMWSLGVCLEIMCDLGYSELKTKNPIFNQIVTGLKEVEWIERYDAKKLCEALNDQENTDITVIEKRFFEILKVKNYEKNKELMELYGNANMPSEKLKIVMHYWNRFEKENEGEIYEENWEEFDDLLWKLGKYFYFFK